MKKLPALLLLPAVLLSACFEEGEDSRRTLLESWGEHVIMPTYRDLEGRAATLQERSIELCENPSETTLRDVQQAWWDARLPWKQMEVLAFGPFTIEPWRLGPRIDSWPVRVESIEQVLFDEGSINADGLGTFQEGFPVIEYLLYQPEIDLVDDFAGFPRRCEYLLVVVADFEQSAKEMRQAWDPDHENYLAELVNAGQGSTTFESLHDALSEIVNRMGFTIENIRADKLGRPLGTSSGGSPQPNKAESQFSGRSIEDIRDNLSGIELLYFGTDNEDSVGLDAYVRSRGANLGPAMREALAASRDTLDEIQGPLTESVIASPEEVSTAVDRLGDLQRLIQVDVLDALSLTPSFNDSDGD